MRICDHWSTDPPRLPFEPPPLYCELNFLALWVLKFDSYADPSPVSYSDKDPNLAYQNDAIPCGSGPKSAILPQINVRKHGIPYLPYLNDSSIGRNKMRYLGPGVGKERSFFIQSWGAPQSYLTWSLGVSLLHSAMTAHSLASGGLPTLEYRK